MCFDGSELMVGGCFLPNCFDGSACVILPSVLMFIGMCPDCSSHPSPPPPPAQFSMQCLEGTCRSPRATAGTGRPSPGAAALSCQICRRSQEFAWGPHTSPCRKTGCGSRALACACVAPARTPSLWRLPQRRTNKLFQQYKHTRSCFLCWNA